MLALYEASALHMPVSFMCGAWLWIMCTTALKLHSVPRGMHDCVDSRASEAAVCNCA